MHTGANKEKGRRMVYHDPTQVVVITGPWWCFLPPHHHHPHPPTPSGCLDSNVVQLYGKHLLGSSNALVSTQSLTPLCEEDNQAQEIVKKLEKSIVLLSQCTARVASRAEMLGAINQVMVNCRGFVLPEGVCDVSKNKFSEHFCAQKDEA